MFRLFFINILIILWCSYCFPKTAFIDYKNLTYIGCINNKNKFEDFCKSLPNGSAIQGSAANKNRGYRSQDRIFVAGKENGVRHYLFGVADGHGGDEVAEYLASPSGIPHLVEKALSIDEKNFSASRLAAVCLLANQRIHKSATTQAGSTLTGVLSVDDSRDAFIFNVADSPAFVVMRNGDVFKTINHDATNPAEIARFQVLSEKSKEGVAYSEWEKRFMFFEKKGGKVRQCGLQPSRDFGLGAGQIEAFRPLPYVYKVPKDNIAFIGVLSDGPVDAWSGVGHPDEEKDVNVDFVEDLIDRSLKQNPKKSVLTDAQLDRVASSYLSSFDDDMSIVFKKFQDPIVIKGADEGSHSCINSHESDRSVIANQFEGGVGKKDIEVSAKHFPIQNIYHKLSAAVVGGALGLTAISLICYAYYKHSLNSLTHNQ